MIYFIDIFMGLLLLIFIGFVVWSEISLYKNGDPEEWYWKYSETDVKEFIRLLKEELGFGFRPDTDVLLFSMIMEKIDKLAGADLK